MPAGKQMVAPFIGLFVGSAMTFRPAMKQAGADSPCIREYQATRLQLLFLLKCVCELLTRVVIFSNGVLGADEMFGSIEGRLLAYETQIRFRLIADDPHLQWTYIRDMSSGMKST